MTGKQKNNSHEARTWLKNNKNPHAFVKNRFKDKKAALEFINKFYQNGAVELIIDHIKKEEWRIKKEGGPYADTLVIELPADFQKRTEIFKLYSKEAKNGGYEPENDEGQDIIILCWS